MNAQSLLEQISVGKFDELHQAVELFGDPNLTIEKRSVIADVLGKVRTSPTLWMATESILSSNVSEQTKLFVLEALDASCTETKWLEWDRGTKESLTSFLWKLVFETFPSNLLSSTERMRFEEIVLARLRSTLVKVFLLSGWPEVQQDSPLSFEAAAQLLRRTTESIRSLPQFHPNAVVVVENALEFLLGCFEGVSTEELIKTALHPRALLQSLSPLLSSCASLQQYLKHPHVHLSLSLSRIVFDAVARVSKETPLTEEIADGVLRAMTPEVQDLLSSSASPPFSLDVLTALLEVDRAIASPSPSLAVPHPVPSALDKGLVNWALSLGSALLSKAVNALGPATNADTFRSLFAFSSAAIELRDPTAEDVKEEIFTLSLRLAHFASTSVTGEERGESLLQTANFLASLVNEGALKPTGEVFRSFCVPFLEGLLKDSGSALIAAFRCPEVEGGGEREKDEPAELEIPLRDEAAEAVSLNNAVGFCLVALAAVDEEAVLTALRSSVQLGAEAVGYVLHEPNLVVTKGLLWAVMRPINALCGLAAAVTAPIASSSSSFLPSAFGASASAPSAMRERAEAWSTVQQRCREIIREAAFPLLLPLHRAIAGLVVGGEGFSGSFSAEEMQGLVGNGAASPRLSLLFSSFVLLSHCSFAKSSPSADASLFVAAVSASMQSLVFRGPEGFGAKKGCIASFQTLSALTFRANGCGLSFYTGSPEDNDLQLLNSATATLSSCSALPEVAFDTPRIASAIGSAFVAAITASCPPEVSVTIARQISQRFFNELFSLLSRVTELCENGDAASIKRAHRLSSFVRGFFGAAAARSFLSSTSFSNEVGLKNEEFLQHFSAFAAEVMACLLAFVREAGDSVAFGTEGLRGLKGIAVELFRTLSSMHYSLLSFEGVAMAPSTALRGSFFAMARVIGYPAALVAACCPSQSSSGSHPPVLEAVQWLSEQRKAKEETDSVQVAGGTTTEDPTACESCVLESVYCLTVLYDAFRASAFLSCPTLPPFLSLTSSPLSLVSCILALEGALLPELPGFSSALRSDEDSRDRLGQAIHFLFKNSNWRELPGPFMSTLPLFAAVLFCRVFGDRWRGAATAESLSFSAVEQRKAGVAWDSALELCQTWRTDSITAEAVFRSVSHVLSLASGLDGGLRDAAVEAVAASLPGFELQQWEEATKDCLRRMAECK